MFMIILLMVILSAAAIYLLLTVCRTGHPDLPKLQSFVYAHRGLHGYGVPENSIRAFQLAKEAGYGIELDVHLLADGNLAVIHDSLLLRTTGLSGRIEDLTTEQLKNCKLEGTDETIPTLQEVLELYSGAAPLIVELKSDTKKNNQAMLAQAACSMLENYNGLYCIESFDPRCVAWLRKNKPQIIRGQLSEDYLKNSVAIPWILAALLRNHLLNIWTYPDFVAYKFNQRNILSNYICRKLWGGLGVAWTISSQEDYDRAIQEGWLPIFEGFRP